MDAVAIATVVGAVATALGVVSAVGAVAWQLRRQWQLNSASMVLALAAKFTSAEWRVYRAHCADQLMKHLGGNSVDLSMDFPILGFFENLGHLVRVGVIDRAMVWNKFGWYIVRYYAALRACDDLITRNRERERDPTLWEEFCWLNNQMLAIYRSRGVHIASGDEVIRQIAELIRQESTAPSLTSAPVRSSVNELAR